MQKWNWTFVILFFHLDVHLWRCTHKRALMGQQKTFLEGSRQSTSRGCSGDQSTSTGSKGISQWNQTFSTLHIVLFWQHISCLQNPVWHKKIQTNQCHFLIIKREIKRIKMESSMIQVEVCNLVTRNGSIKCYHILSEQHSELNVGVSLLF